MHITIEHHNDQFNVNLSSKEGSEAFLSIKGCRIVDGQKGQFVSYPARKKDDGKWWNHVWAGDKFNAAVISKFNESKPKPAPRQAPPAATQGSGFDDVPDDDIPFITASPWFDMTASKQRRMARYDF